MIDLELNEILGTLHSSDKIKNISDDFYNTLKNTTQTFKKGDKVQQKYCKNEYLKNKIATIHDYVYDYYILSVDGIVLRESFYAHELELVQPANQYNSKVPITININESSLSNLTAKLEQYYISKNVIAYNFNMYMISDYYGNHIKYNIILQYNKNQNMSNMKNIKVKGLEKFTMSELSNAIEIFVNSESVKSVLDISYAIAQKNNHVTLYSAIIIYEEI